MRFSLKYVVMLNVRKASPYSKFASFKLVPFMIHAAIPRLFG